MASVKSAFVPFKEIGFSPVNAKALFQKLKKTLQPKPQKTEVVKPASEESAKEPAPKPAPAPAQGGLDLADDADKKARAVSAVQKLIDDNIIDLPTFIDAANSMRKSWGRMNEIDSIEACACDELEEIYTVITQ